ncbi:thiosulfate oxidation carrier protein SoxY [Paralimibaculum aggregatum]|uniref:Thiosulfate oxidation carrier protein SoxY n=1 Tax=Paralimibaculum aggregatum TaxID=3036245 RepID=A0ABQ6LF97_9RHOB|nr:thiosulfate oxidation carrier protein SoxY [Limibaculum sp. NKW23]GMG81993.1 thiosulfate oxidation carrier protein SoxY [Limibaculum sp. NKW23]
MTMTRRDFTRLGLGAAAVAATGLGLAPRPAEAAGTVEEAIAAFTGGAETTEGGIDLGAPEIAENGNTVPIEVAAEGAAAIMLLASGNPSPGVATFRFGKLAAASAASTRIRLAQTQDIVAVAEMKDGSFRKVSRTVKVTIGGCGG